MDTKLKDGYLIAGGFIVVGLIFIYVNWLKLEFGTFFGICLTVLGVAGFKWPSVAEVLVQGEKYRVIRKRESLQSLWALEQ